MIPEEVWLFPDSVWMLMLIWIILLVFGLQDQTIGAAASIIGVMFGFVIMPLMGNWIGLILVCLNVYLLYKAIFVEVE